MTNYSFTVTLNPKMHRYEPEEQYDRCKNDLYMLLKSLSNNFTLVVELTQNMNAHMHGIIELHHKKHWYKAFRKSDIFGFTTCREIYDMEGWKEYIRKSLKDTYDTINRRPILRDDFKVYSENQIFLYGTQY